jgi:DNA-binding PadR family transcriptional regulator
MVTQRTDTPEPNTLGYAILQLLERAPLSGYDVKKQFASSLGYGWYAHDSQIYPQLKQLERLGFVLSHIEASSAGPERRVYAITASGRAVLVHWLQSPIDDSRQKSELMLRVWSQDLIPSDAFKAMLADVELQTREHLRRMLTIRQKLLARHGPPEVAADPQVVGTMLCLEHDIQLAQAKLTWLERAGTVVATRAVLAGVPRPAGDTPSTEEDDSLAEDILLEG